MMEEGEVQPPVEQSANHLAIQKSAGRWHLGDTNYNTFGHCIVSLDCQQMPIFITTMGGKGIQFFVTGSG